METYFVCMGRGRRIKLITKTVSQDLQKTGHLCTGTIYVGKVLSFSFTILPKIKNVLQKSYIWQFLNENPMAEIDQEKQLNQFKDQQFYSSWEVFWLHIQLLCTLCNYKSHLNSALWWQSLNQASKTPPPLKCKYEMSISERVRQ